MNRQAVALAADSAVTIESEGSKKSWQSANKIFGLSRQHPLAIMVYGGSAIMGVPWDTVIKMYRDQLGGVSFPHVSDYADDFLKFLAGQRDLFPPDAQRQEFAALVGVTYLDLVEQVAAELRDRFPDDKPVSLADVRTVVSEIVGAELDAIDKKMLPLPHVSDAELEKLSRSYRDVIADMKNEAFQDLPLTSATSRKLTRLALLLFARDTFTKRVSGVVIAGYGDRDHFPSLEAFRIEAVINNYVNYARDDPGVISRSNGAVVRAFAQSEMVYAFMEGIDGQYQNFIEQAIDELVRQYPQVLLKQVKGIGKERREQVAEQLEDAAETVIQQFVQICEGVRSQYYARPIIQVVTVLPRDELAAMAEALVNLTSFRRKVSLQVETVGGPIDVAVVSKGDGFVWIKRKNYFDLGMNPHVLARYFKN